MFASITVRQNNVGRGTAAHHARSPWARTAQAHCPTDVAPVGPSQPEQDAGYRDDRHARGRIGPLAQYVREQIWRSAGAGLGRR